MFTSLSSQSTFNPSNWSFINNVGLVGFGMYSFPNTTYYYVMDSSRGVHILNDQWSFITFKTFTLPAYTISINNSLYMTGNLNVWKVDQDLNILRNYNPGGYSGYLGISYNPSNGLLYVESWYLDEIQVFNLVVPLLP